MNYFGVILLVFACLVAVCVHCQQRNPEPKVGQPQFSLKGAGTGKNLRNFNAGFNAGVGTKVWESKNKHKSLELGVNYGQGFSRVNGQTFKSPPQYGVGATYKWGRK